MLLLVLMGALLAGCGDKESQSADPLDPLVITAKQFRAHVKAGEYDEARAMMVQNPRRWFNEREGEGREWKLGPKSGPWSEWDDHFRGRTEVVRWEVGEGTATLVFLETNDYFQLLDRGWQKSEMVYYFNDAGEIEGLLIRGRGDRPQGRTEEFLAWARENDPEELAYLMPDGDVDPSGDRPPRFRALLNRWRESAGLEPIEIEEEN